MMCIKIVHKKEEKIMSEDLLNSNNNSKYGMEFEKGKWVQIPNDPSGSVYQLLELKGNDLVVDAWFKNFDEYKARDVIECRRNYSLSAKMLYNFEEIPRPDWVHE